MPDFVPRSEGGTPGIAGLKPPPSDPASSPAATPNQPANVSTETPNSPKMNPTFSLSIVWSKNPDATAHFPTIDVQGDIFPVDSRSRSVEKHIVSAVFEALSPLFDALMVPTETKKHFSHALLKFFRPSTTGRDLLGFRLIPQDDRLHHFVYILHKLPKVEDKRVLCYLPEAFTNMVQQVCALQYLWIIYNTADPNLRLFESMKPFFSSSFCDHLLLKMDESSFGHSIETTDDAAVICEALHLGRTKIYKDQIPPQRSYDSFARLFEQSLKESVKVDTTKDWD